MIIDTHTHFYDPSRPEGVPWPSANDEVLYRTVLPEGFRKLAEPVGVTGTVVVEASAWLEDNQWILDLAENDSCIVGLVGHVDANRPEFKSEIERFATHPLFRGIRAGGGYFNDLDEGSFLTDMEFLATKELELDVILSVAQWDGLIALAERIPELPVVINHVAGARIDGNAPDAQWVECMQRAAAFPQMHMKVSALVEGAVDDPAPAEVGYYEPTLDVLWEAFGEDRLVYGSNWPVSARFADYATTIGIVRSYFEGKGSEAAEKYWWKNAKKVYGWVDRS